MHYKSLYQQGMGKWELWTDEIKDAPPIPKVQLYLYDEIIFSCYHNHNNGVDTVYVFINTLFLLFWN